MKCSLKIWILISSLEATGGVQNVPEDYKSVIGERGSGVGVGQTTRPWNKKALCCPWKHFPIYMMATTLFTPSVDSKDAAGEQKCDTGAKKSFRSELKEKRGDEAEEGSDTLNVGKSYFNQSDFC